jgi:hypothetical protein
MRIGLLDRTAEAGVFLTPLARRALKVGHEDFVDIKSDDRGSAICRSVRPLETSCKVMDEYIYMDGQSIQFLGAEINDYVRVSPAAFPIESP